MAEVKLARAPVPDGDPRIWLVEEVLKQGATALPCVLTTVVGDERLVALPENSAHVGGQTDPDQNTELGVVEAALFRDFTVDWVGAWGTAVLDHDGRPALVTFVRIREQNGQVFVAVWQRSPGQPPIAELAERYDGPLAKAPRWLRSLFPPLVESPVRFVDWQFDDNEPTDPRAGWSGSVEGVDEVVPTGGGAEDGSVSVTTASEADRGLPSPDFGAVLPEGASLEDALVAAAQRLEARFVGGKTGPALVAWHEGGISGWFGNDDSAAGALKRLGSRIAVDERILGLGLFGLGEDEGVDPPARLIALAMESREGERVVWIRRFRIGDGAMASWVDASGFVRRPGPRIGWFEAPEA